MSARRESRLARRERQLRAAAFHEAGHAVAAYHLRVRLRRISIGGDEGDALGWLDLWLPHVTRGDAANIHQAQAVERDIIVLLAGAQAERVGLGRSSCPAGGPDFYEAMRRAGAICRTGEEMSACLRWLQLRTHALVQSPTWRQPIDTLAARLLERRQLGARETRASMTTRPGHHDSAHVSPTCPPERSLSEREARRWKREGTRPRTASRGGTPLGGEADVDTSESITTMATGLLDTG